jgi:hypothetical protein
MRLTATHLRRIIREEVAAVREADGGAPFPQAEMDAFVEALAQHVAAGQSPQQMESAKRGIETALGVTVRKMVQNYKRQ